MSQPWIDELLGGTVTGEGETIVHNGRKLVLDQWIIRDLTVADTDQTQTRDTFAYKWQQQSTYASESMASAQIDWLDSRYGGRDLLDHLGGDLKSKPIVLDAGCGSGFSAKLMFKDKFDRIRYVGADISEAVEIAAEEIGAIAPDSLFLQADLMHLPFADGAFDIVFSEGVLHHTPSTRGALLAVAPLVKPGGILALYVYNKKAPIREFTDDYIREVVSNLAPVEAWKELEPLTRLGIALGELNCTIDVMEDVPLLGITKGKHDIQRLFYWTICKSYYRPEFTFEEMNHINFDWFTPKYCHRQTPEEVTTWCAEAGLNIEHLQVEEAGITVVARRPTETE